MSGVTCHVIHDPYHLSLTPTATAMGPPPATSSMVILSHNLNRQTRTKMSAMVCNDGMVRKISRHFKVGHGCVSCWPLFYLTFPHSPSLLTLLSAWSKPQATFFCIRNNGGLETHPVQLCLYKQMIDQLKKEVKTVEEFLL